MIFGSGGFAREVYYLCQNSGIREVIGFISPKYEEEKNKDKLLPKALLGKDDDLSFLIDTYRIDTFISAIGHPETRHNLFEYASGFHLCPKNIVHPSSVILTEIDDIGCVIYPNVTIMNDCSLGKGVLLNSNSSIGHDTNIGDFCNINPGANIAGKVVIGAGTTIGIGTVVRENIKIGQNVIIGAGSVVVKDIQDNQVVYGNPARKKR